MPHKDQEFTCPTCLRSVDHLVAKRLHYIHTIEDDEFFYEKTLYVCQDCEKRLPSKVEQLDDVQLSYLKMVARKTRNCENHVRAINEGEIKDSSQLPIFRNTMFEAITAFEHLLVRK